MQLEHVGPLLVVEPESSSEIGDLGGGQVRSGRRCRRRGRGAYGGANHCGAVQEKKRNTGGRNLRKKAGISHLHCTWVLPSPPLPSPPPPGTGSRRRRGDDEGSDWRSGNAGGRQSEKSHLSPRAPTFSSLLLLLLLLLVS
jgi:hypothetical protein